MFGTTDPYIILDQLSYQGEKARECGDWLQTIIGQLINDEMSIKASQKQSNKIRESYSDNPRKPLNNFILNKVQPQCSINECILHDYFADSFRINDDDFVPDEDGIFAISNCYSEHDKEIFLNLITDEDSFVEVIKSRMFKSAAGPDSIDYSVFKISPVDINSLNNWRPISFSNSIYRIFSCVWAKSINKVNLDFHIFSKMQRGFIENVNGAATMLLLSPNYSMTQ